MEQQKAFQLQYDDNVATALTPIEPGEVTLLGDANSPFITSIAHIPVGHKIALENIKENEDIIKYGVVIGKSTAPISKGSWVHLHCIRSIYDERSSHLDTVTGAPKDIEYE